jgi:hypothetical protein
MSFTTIGRAIVIWLAIIAMESVHGALRGLVLVPWMGDFPARRLSVFTGSLLILAVACVFIRWLRARSRGELLAVGGLWVVLTVLFEIGLGRFVLGLSWDRLLEDYDMTRGGLMVFGLLFMMMSPLLAARIRGMTPTEAGPLR